MFRGRIVDVSPEQVMIEISGQEKKIEAFIEQSGPTASSSWPAPAGSPWSAATGRSKESAGTEIEAPAARLPTEPLPRPAVQAALRALGQLC